MRERGEADPERIDKDRGRGAANIFNQKTIVLIHE